MSEVDRPKPNVKRTLTDIFGDDPYFNLTTPQKSTRDKKDPRLISKRGSPEEKQIKVEQSAVEDLSIGAFNRNKDRLKGIKQGVIVSLIFEIATEEQIRGHGRCKVTIAKLDEMTGCIMDPAMGASTNTTPCTKCGKGIKHCPGHPGFFELALPIYNPAYIQMIVKIMKLFCYTHYEQSEKAVTKYKNNYVLETKGGLGVPEGVENMSKSEYDMMQNKRRDELEKEALEQPDAPKLHILPLFDPIMPEQKFRDIYGMRRISMIEKNKKNKKCPKEHDEIKYSTPLKLKWFITQTLGKENVTLNPRRVKEFFRAIDNDTYDNGKPRNWSRILGLGHNKLEALVMKVFPVLPNTQRPTKILPSGNSERDKLSHIYLKIMTSNIALNEIIGSRDKVKDGFDTMLSEDNTKSEGPSARYYYDDINSNIHNLFFAKDEQSEEGYDNDRPGAGSSVPKSATTMVNGKFGLLRRDIMGKGADHSGRTVIIGDPNIDVDEVGISKSFAESITIPEDILTQEDVDIWTAELPIFEKGKRISGIVVRIEKPKGAMITINEETKIAIEIGDVVRRQIVDGDPLVISRQPVLHKGGMMGFWARVFEGGGNVLRINPAVTGPFNADFDGDEMNLAVPQAVKVRHNVNDKMMITRCIRGDQYSSPWIGLIQNSILAADQMTQSNVIVEDSLISAIWTAAEETYGRRNPNNIFRNSPSKFKRELASFKTRTLPVSGRAVLSYFFPSDFGYEKRKKGKEPVIIERGIILSGVMDKQDLGKVSNGIIDAMLEQYDPETVITFLSAITRGLFIYIESAGFTLGPSDCLLPKEGQLTVNNLIDDVRDDVRHLLETTSKSGDLRNLAELEVRKKLSAVGDRINSIVTAGGVDIVAMRGKLDNERTDLKLYEILMQIYKDTEVNLDFNHEIYADFIGDKTMTANNDSYKNLMLMLAKRIKIGKLGEVTVKKLDELTLLNEISVLKFAAKHVAEKEVFDTFNSITLQMLSKLGLKKGLIDIIQVAIDLRSTIVGANVFSNRFLTIVHSGAKGNPGNITQVLGLVGQQELEGERIGKDLSRDRALPFFEEGDLDPVSQGFCFSSFSNGLTLTEFFQHAQASRQNMVISNLKPAITGYFYRRAYTILGDIRAYPDGSARDESGRVVQFVYGGDMFDPRRLINVVEGDLPQFINIPMSVKSIRTAEGKTEFQFQDE